MSDKKIEVLHTITRLIIGGAQENTILTAQLLDNNKYDVEVVSGTQLGAEGSLFEEAKKRNVEVVKFSNLVREISPVKDLIHLFEMIFFLKKKKYHIIHTHSSKAGIIHRIAAKIAKVPIIIHTVHGWSFNDELSSFSKKFYILLEKICSTFTDKIITVTDYDIKKGLTENIGKSKQYTTIHSSIEIERYKTPSKSKLKIIKELGINENNIIVGTVSRMSAQKAPIDFMKAAKIICQKYPNTQFLFVGDGELRNEVENYIIQNGLVGKVILSGLRHDVPNMLHVMDIFILSSLWEGLPRVFSQAMAAKLPIVATKVNGAPEAIEEGENGFLVSPGKPQEMADKIEILLENDKLRKKMGEKGYRIVDPAFNVVNMVKNIEVVYEECLKKL
ncbi:MAG: glycosyltransferase family 4 protein [Candidatus Cloacimonetes bacterium]|nr:glycosyltransferase family 4 protein [Candidatus Cloacimonadota bacterium]